MLTEPKLKKDDPYDKNIATGTMPPKNRNDDKGNGCRFNFLLLLAALIAGAIYLLANSDLLNKWLGDI